jgi:hypothetical protein
MTDHSVTISTLSTIRCVRRHPQAVVMQPRHRFAVARPILITADDLAGRLDDERSGASDANRPRRRHLTSVRVTSSIGVTRIDPGGGI